MKKRITRTLALAMAATMMLGTLASAAEYTVVSGDTLGKIATVYGTSWETLAEINDLANPNLIYPGDVITLPDTTAAVPEVEEEVMPQVEPEAAPEMLPEEGEELLPPDDMMMEGEGDMDMAPIVSGRMISLEVGNAIEDDLLAERGGEAVVGGYPIVDTNQTTFYSTDAIIDEPAVGDAFYGQDAQYTGNEPSYTDNGDGTVTDNVTGLMWQQDPGEKMTYLEAYTNLFAFNEAALGGYSDWRIPTIKELFSLIDLSGNTGMGSANSTPYIDTDYFEFTYGDEAGEQRFIDSQILSSTVYDALTMDTNTTVFGYNFADGRIKGYEANKNFYCYYVRGNTSYGLNLFVDNGDGTITDQATSLMWMQEDSGSYSADVEGDGSMNWVDALTWAAEMNEIEYLGYSDWRVPNVKELQSLVDYSKSPVVTGTPCIDDLFYCSKIINYFGEEDYGYYWSSTTHDDSSAAPTEYGAACYVVFGTAMGTMDGEIVDVHGSGAQKSDPKEDLIGEYPRSDPGAPQGDEQRVYNMVRLVRDWDDEEA